MIRIQNIVSLAHQEAHQTNQYLIDRLSLRLVPSTQLSRSTESGHSPDP